MELVALCIQIIIDLVGDNNADADSSIDLEIQLYQLSKSTRYWDLKQL